MPSLLSFRPKPSTLTSRPPSLTPKPSTINPQTPHPQPYPYCFLDPCFAFCASTYSPLSRSIAWIISLASESSSLCCISDASARVGVLMLCIQLQKEYNSVHGVCTVNCTLGSVLSIAFLFFFLFVFFCLFLLFFLFLFLFLFHSLFLVLLLCLLLLLFLFFFLLFLLFIFADTSLWSALFWGLYNWIWWTQMNSGKNLKPVVSKLWSLCISDCTSDR